MEIPSKISCAVIVTLLYGPTMAWCGSVIAPHFLLTRESKNQVEFNETKKAGINILF